MMIHDEEGSRPAATFEGMEPVECKWCTRVFYMRPEYRDCNYCDVCHHCECDPPEETQ